MDMHRLLKRKMVNLRCLTIPRDSQVIQSPLAKTRGRNTIFLMADQNTVEAKMVKVAQARLTATKDVTALLVMTLVLTVRIIVHRHHRHHLTMVHQQAIMMTHLAAALLAKATFLVPDLLAEVLPLSIMDLHLSGSNTMMSIMMRIRMFTSIMVHRLIGSSMRSMVLTTSTLNTGNSPYRQSATGFIVSGTCCAILSGAMSHLPPT
jgi:hypothetical protein